MVAPIDSKVSFQVEGETFTLRLNFRTIALAKKEGINLLGGLDGDPIDSAIALRCLATPEHPDLTDEEAFALIARGSDVVANAIRTLMEDFGGQVSPEGNAPKRRKAKV